ncbi:FAD-binding oxidoreductase [Caballeronia sp. SEWSISQ10-4 2]|uniref:NAD(P)/FAD-dependent oxidoreductase n=1 Tax=Caballeronia sp. SEWSISQ10-4 2 TaxID=2937438 RepID=UPI0026572AF6|nr:FAD-dependent oxidoreductase [Caballeronia sp. SEWSISQ10-4 2]MDN7181257.1 FAD-binding oxidoreductase [Caballeronia sp. SEWSISQ10-4 2]
MTSAVFDVAVIGGGLHGLSAALHLGRAGKRVVVLERAWVGRHASGASAAGVRTLNRDLGELDLALESMEMWHNIGSLVGDDCGFHAHGQICVAEQPGILSKLEERVSRLNGLGYTHEAIIDARELRRRVPAISRHCIGASIAPDNGAADPHRTLAAFRRSAQATGVVIREGCGVRRIERRGQDWSIEMDGAAVTDGERGGGQALGRDQSRDHGRGQTSTLVVPFVINAAGAWSGRIAAMVGDDIPLDTKASMMIVSERLAPMIEPVVSIMGRSLSFKQSDQGTLVIGGGLQGIPNLDAETSVVRMGVLSKGARAATDLFPCVRDIHIVRVWSGLEAKTEDLLPVIGAAVNAPGVFHAFGYSGHGFQLVPVVGAALTDLIVSGSTRRAIGALNARRLTATPPAEVAA